MEGLDGIFVGVRGNCAIGEVWGKGGEEAGLECVYCVVRKGRWLLRGMGGKRRGYGQGAG